MTASSCSDTTRIWALKLKKDATVHVGKSLARFGWFQRKETIVNATGALLLLSLSGISLSRQGSREDLPVERVPDTERRGGNDVPADLFRCKMHSVPFDLPAVDALHRPDLREAILSMPVAHTLGLRLMGLAPGVSVMELDVRPELTFDGRTVQGGIVGTLADFAGVSAATAALSAGGAASTTGFEVHHLAPARGERLVAVGRAAFVGRSHAVSRVEVHALQEGQEPILVAIGTTTCRLMLPVVPQEEKS